MIATLAHWIKLRVSYAAIIIIATTFVFAARSKPPAAKANIPADADPVDPARDMVNALNTRWDADAPLTPEFLEMNCEWSRRLRDAELRIAHDEDRRRAAAEAHLKRVRDIHERLHGILDAEFTRLHLATVEYHLREARLRLVEIDRER